MKIINLIIGITLLNFALNTWAIGGKIGNGGGGDVDVLGGGPWIPMGPLGEVMQSSVSLQGQEILQNLKEKFPEVEVRACANNSSRYYPEMPKDISSLIELKMLKKPGLLASLFKQPTIENFDIEYVCQDEGALNSYISLVESLLLVNRSDEVSKRIIEHIVQKQKTLKFVIGGFTVQLDGSPEAPTDFASFDHETGQIYWGEREERKGFSALFGRPSLAFLRHELVHVLLWNNYGNQYPQVDKWHDIEALMSTKTKDCVKNFGPNLVLGNFEAKSCWERFETSQPAAFIEGLAFALEAGLTFEHPYVDDRDLTHLIYSKDMDAYFYFDNDLPNIAAINTERLQTSEVFVASSIVRFFEDMKTGSLSSYKGGSQAIVHYKSPEKMMDMVDAIAKYAPKNVEELAKAYDMQTGKDIGRGWLREYYMYDYVEQRSILSDMRWVYKKDSRRKVLTLAASSAQPLFTTYIDELESKRNGQAEKELAAQVTTEQIKEDIEKIRNQVSGTLEHFQSTLGMSLNSALIARTKMDDKIKALDARNRKDRDVQIEFYRLLEDQYKRTVALAQIGVYLDSNGAIEFAEEVEKYQGLEAQLVNIVDDVESMSAQDHRSLVKTSYRLMKKYRNQINYVYDYMMLSLVVTNHPEILN